MSERGIAAKEEGASWWRAVQAHDHHFDGHFVYGVRSTGIYCRPSCGSRRPQRKHVIFFPRAEAAEVAGFRPCKRCQPRMFAEWLEKERMEEELRVAAEIQRRLQPRALPAMEGWEVKGAISSCREVGGDYLDFFRRSKDNRIVLALGDVAGKGAGAAILMASLHAAVRAQSRLGIPVCEVMKEINRYLCDNTPADRFVTLFYAELDLETGALEYANAGHPPVLLRKASGEVIRLTAGGLPVGIVADAVFRPRTARLEAGDVLIAYTDGVHESVNGVGEEFGEERLIELARESADWSAAKLCDRFSKALARFGGTEPAVDDRTLLIVKRTVNPADQVVATESGDRRLALAYA